MRRLSTKGCVSLVLAMAMTLACGSTSIPGDPPAPVTDCGTTLKLCGVRCVDTRFDPANCGDCGVSCGLDTACSNGVCGLICLGGTTACGKSCVDTRYDPANCGFCDNACNYAVACLAGACAKGCGSKQATCSTGCKNTSNDNDNCGACGTVCGPGTTCTNGVCKCTGTLCDGTCTDLQTDVNHCGACGTACNASFEACVAGKCGCAIGLTACSGTCIDTATSPRNCGACGKTCAATEICDAGTCTNPTTDWPTQGANESRNGVVAGEVGRPPLQHIWSVTPNSSADIQPVAVGKNRIFVTVTYVYPTSTMRALDLSDGSLVWSRPLGPISSTGFPTYAAGRVYIVNGKGYDNTPASVVALEAGSGVLAWSAALASQYDNYWSPLVVGDSLYTDAGYYGGLQAFDIAQGTSKYWVGGLDQFDRWAPTWSGSEVLTFLSGTLRAHVPASGALSWSIYVDSAQFHWVAYPVVGAGRAFVIDNYNLYAINLATHVVDWTGYGAYVGVPVVSGGTVCALSSGTLVARDAATGALQWFFTGDGKLNRTPAIANGFIYVASDSNVYAVDLSTHQQVWSAPVGGDLVIASRRLLIASKGTLHAYRMSN